MRKFADKQTIRQRTKNRQTDRRFKDWDHSILCGYSRELANNCTVLHSSVLYCIKRGGWKREKWENLQTHNQADKEQRTKVSTTESTLILSGYSRELANNSEGWVVHRRPKKGHYFLKKSSSRKCCKETVIQCKVGEKSVLGGISNKMLQNSSTHTYYFLVFSV